MRAALDANGYITLDVTNDEAVFLGLRYGTRETWARIVAEAVLMRPVRYFHVKGKRGVANEGFTAVYRSEPRG